MSENNFDFEKSLAELENIIKQLESGECSLEDSISLFEKGMKHTTECRKALDSAQKRITELCELERSENNDD